MTTPNAGERAEAAQVAADILNSQPSKSPRDFLAYIVDRIALALASRRAGEVAKLREAMQTACMACVQLGGIDCAPDVMKLVQEISHTLRAALAVKGDGNGK